MKNGIISLLTFTLLFSQGCKKDSSEPLLEPIKIDLPEKSDEVISGSNKFGIDLFLKTAKVESGNIMLSPLSASAALTMLLNGCENNTLLQIQQLLGYEGLTKDQINNVYKSLVKQLLDADPSVKLALANAVWYREGFEVKPPFLLAMNDDFSAHLEGLDFSSPSALTKMNGWANENTFGKIPKVLNEISPDAVMFLMNALYFKGVWTNKFDKTKTQNEIFYNSDGSEIQVPMMHISLKANVFSNEKFKAVELNYGRKNYSMIVLIPNDYLDSFYSSFDNGVWRSLTNYFTNSNPNVEWKISMPRFKFSYEKFLNDQLISMGMSDAFNPVLANLSGISDANLVVDFVKQNTFVEVNEEGTEAAAVTTIGIELTSVGPNNEFVVDKPFVFAIREKTTNTILFIGKVVNPNL